MPLKAILMGETGDERKYLPISPTADLWLPGPEDESFRCAGFIDIYGHTVFNWLQMPTLMSEILRLEAQQADEDARYFLRELYGLAEECRDGIHLYLKLMGD